MRPQCCRYSEPLKYLDVTQRNLPAVDLRDAFSIAYIASFCRGSHGELMITINSDMFFHLQSPFLLRYSTCGGARVT